MEKRRLIIIVPAFNEEGSIGETVQALQMARADMPECDTKIYVINDGSHDATAQEAASAGADRIVTHQTNRGLGAAVRTGLTAARHDGADLVVKFDADRQHDASDIARLIRPILDDAAEIVYGNRFARIEYRMPLVRNVGNRVFRGLMKWLTGWPLKDSQPGIFAVGRDYLKVFNLPGDYNYTQQVLLDGYLKGMRFEHVDVAFRQREKGKSFVSFKYPLKVLPQILMVLIAVRPLRVFVPLGLAFLGVGGLVFAVELCQYLFGHAIKPVESVNFVLGTGLFGMQTLFFGLLAELIVFTRRP